MDPINPWIDPGETRRMAERLMVPSRMPVAAPEDTGFDDSFVGFSDPEPEQDRQVQNQRSPADPAASEPDATERKVAGRADESAFAEHRKMLLERFSAIASFMVDPQGELIFSDGDFENFHFIVRDLAKSSSPPIDVRLKVGAKAILEAMPLEGDGGFYWLAIVLPGPLHHDAMDQLRLHWSAIG